MLIGDAIMQCNCISLCCNAMEVQHIIMQDSHCCIFSSFQAIFSDKTWQSFLNFILTLKPWSLLIWKRVQALKWVELILILPCILIGLHSKALQRCSCLFEEVFDSNSDGSSQESFSLLLGVRAKLCVCQYLTTYYSTTT